ncbi:unnamed protein product [Symbiodinium natans]|uniref:Uncharacterized protein n=1 Tax=Symbiodinium natans TaxID=878477 RepID=A0A812RTA8_9DINO|nr:unnamed protein product [Symbiodinium natans]
MLSRSSDGIMFDLIQQSSHSTSAPDLEEGLGLRLFLARQRIPLEALQIKEFRQSCFTGSKTLYICDDRLGRPPSPEEHSAEAVEHCQSCHFCGPESHLLYLDDSTRQGWRAWRLGPLGPLGPLGEPFASHDARVADVSHITPIENMEPERLAQGLEMAQELGRAFFAARGPGSPGVQTDQTVQTYLSYMIKHGSLAGALCPRVHIALAKRRCPQFERRLSLARQFHQKYRRCSVCHCHVVAPLRDGQSADRLLHQTGDFVAIIPYASTPYRVSIIPKQHSACWLQLGAAIQQLAFLLQLVVEAMHYVLANPSYTVYILSVDGQSELEKENTFEAFHWSMEVQARLPVDFGLQLSSGLRVASRLPEDCAQDLRAAMRACLSRRAQLVVDDL